MKNENKTEKLSKFEEKQNYIRISNASAVLTLTVPIIIYIYIQYLRVWNKFYSLA
jgi:hypothetical protein